MGLILINLLRRRRSAVALSANGSLDIILSERILPLDTDTLMEAQASAFRPALACASCWFKAPHLLMWEAL